MQMNIAKTEILGMSKLQIKEEKFQSGRKSK
jgi:hypothetical protein